MIKSKLIKGLERPNWLKSNARNPKKTWIDKNELINQYFLNKFVKIQKKLNSYNYSTYPDLSKLYHLFSKKIKFPPDQIFFTNGSDDGIKYIFQIFGLNKKVLIINPTFAMYEIYSKIFSRKYYKIDYKYSEDGPYLDISSIISVIKKNNPKLLCLANPNSPTGTTFSDKEIVKILKISKNQNTFVLIDEAYYPLSKITSVNLIKKFDNLIIVRSFSKSYGLAGLRLGYILSNKFIINELHSIKGMYELGNYSASFLFEILRQKFNINKVLNKVRNDKLFFIKKLAQLGLKVHYGPANFIHVNLGKNKIKIIRELKKNFYFREEESHKSLEGFSRFSLTNKKNYLRIINIIKNEI